jgi:hypothetical protein
MEVIIKDRSNWQGRVLKRGSTHKENSELYRGFTSSFLQSTYQCMHVQKIRKAEEILPKR